jgi:hypothetical protein
MTKSEVSIGRHLGKKILVQLHQRERELKQAQCNKVDGFND